MQLAPAPRLEPQVVCARLKGAAVATVSPVAACAPVLVTVTVCGGLAWPSVASTKAICAGFTLMPAAAWPVPFRGTVAGFTPSVEEVTVRVAVAPPAEAGVKSSCTVQLAPLASEAPQVVEPAEKLDADAPVT